MSITVRVNTLLILVTVVPFTIVATSVYSFAKSQSTATAFQRLTDEASNTAAQITDHVENLEEEISTTAAISALVDATPEITKSAVEPTSVSYRNARSKVDGILGYLPKLHNYSELLLVSPNGILAYTSLPNNTNIGKRVDGDNLTAYTSGQVGPYRSQTIVSNDTGQRFSLILSHPIRQTDGSLVGVLISHVPMDKVFRDIEFVPGFSQTGETYFGTSDGTVLSLMSPLRGDSVTAGLRTVNTTDEHFSALARAARGSSGTMKTVDYRNKQVLAAYQYISSLQWGVVTQVDASEGLSVIGRVVFPLIFGVALASMLIIALIMRVTYRWIRQPLEHLTKITRHIEHNDYENAVVDPKLLYSQDVIGRLGTHLQHIVNEHKHHDHKKTSEHDDL